MSEAPILRVTHADRQRLPRDAVGTHVVDGLDDLLALIAASGGEVPEFRVTSTHFQWRYVGASEWTNLIALSELEGADGLSAYEVAVLNGFEGSEVEWLASLIGTDGLDGQNGLPGPNEVTTATDSAITGILKGAAGKVAQAVAGTDYPAVGHNHDAAYAPIAKGVTGGDAHDHNGGDGAQIDHVNLSNKGTNTHAQVDTHLGAAAPHSGHEATANKGAANGYAGLGAAALVPAAQLATGTPTGSKFLRDDQSWQSPPGGGSVADSDLAMLVEFVQ